MEIKNEEEPRKEFSWKKIIELFKVIFSSSLEIFSIFAIYLVNLARAILTKTYGSGNSLRKTIAVSEIRNYVSDTFLTIKNAVSDTFLIRIVNWINKEIELKFDFLKIVKVKNIITIILILISIMSVFSTIMNAADPGHGASVVGAGTFESGSYVFPVNLTITNNLSVNGSTLFVRDNGNVGIGTTEPGTKLEVVGDTLLSNNGAYRIKNAAGTANLIVGYLDPNNLMQLGASNNAGTAFYSGSATETMRMTTAGNVGIGTTAPRSTLEVSGNLTVTGNSTFQSNMTIQGGNAIRFNETSNANIYYNGSCIILRGPTSKIEVC